MKQYLSILLPVCLVLGCDSEPVPEAPPAPAPPEAAPSVTTPSLSQTTSSSVPVPQGNLAPPPPPAVPGSTPAAAPVAEGTMPKNAKNLAAYQAYFDPNGNPLNGIAVLQRAAYIYEQIQSSQVPDDLDGDGEDDPMSVWPPLTNINYLVEKKVIPFIPPPPDGQEYFFNQQSRQVELRVKP